jgi:adrenodoxin-NADP+ reductase
LATNCALVFDAGNFAGVKESVKELKRPRKRLTELMAKTALDPPTAKQFFLWDGAEKTWQLKLLRTPLRVLPAADGISVAGLKVGINRLAVGEKVSEAQAVEDTGETEILECGLVLRSIGYKSVRVEEGVPFDDKLGVVPNEGGRVASEPGLYCAGWLATGPRGVIVDTMTEAFLVGQNVVQDLNGSAPGNKKGFEGLKTMLKERGVSYVEYDDWEAIDAAEKEHGERKGKPREKMTSVGDLLEAANKEPQQH